MKSKNRHKIILLILILSILFTIINTYAHNWSKLNSDANYTNNDNWTLTWSLINENPNSANYSSWLRWEIIINTIKSTLFGDFLVKSWKIELYDSINTNCGSGTTYKIDWNLNISSIFWWDMNIDQNNSFFCPQDSKLWLTFLSQNLWQKIIWEINNLTWKIFDTKEIYINWITSIKWNEDNLWKNITDAQYINNITPISWELSKLDLSINKNITQITKNLNAEINDNNINTIKNDSNNEKYYYFDYSTQEWNDNSLWNKWKNLTIKNYNFDTNNLSHYKIWVKWKNTIIVEWWNIYINADIYNENDNEDILIIIAKRDNTNTKNWWNIYINPNVTNIDAILIADWSLLSYDGNNALNVIDNNSNLLWKQLLIYGSVNTKNIIWENKTVYWTDTYIENWNETESNYYNLVNMRELYITYASNSNLEECWWDDTKIIAKQTNNTVLNYAFAGKKECFLDDSNIIEGLKTTNKTNSLVIMYNPNLQKIQPYILKNN